MQPKELNRTAAHIKEFWHTCPMCLARPWQWTILGHVALPIFDDRRCEVPTPRAIPCTAVVCKRCGFTSLLNNIVSLKQH